MPSWRESAAKMHGTAGISRIVLTDYGALCCSTSENISTIAAEIEAVDLVNGLSYTNTGFKVFQAYW